MASDLYFRKNATDLTLEECALIAGLPKAPEYYSPFKNKQRALIRRNFVLTRMSKKKLISEKDFQIAIKKPIKIADSIYKEKYASYFVEYIRQDLEQKYGDMLYKGGLKIYTTLDLDMQISAVDSLEKHLAEFDKVKKEKIAQYLATKKVGYLEDDVKKYTSLEAYKNIQGSIIALDTKTGQIRALVGGRDFKKSQFNRAIQAKRQPGSSFKPIIYTGAIDSGIPPNFMLKDEPVIYYNNGQDWQLVGKTKDFSDVSPQIMNSLKLADPAKRKSKDRKHKYDPMQIWMPSNYSKKYLGNITLRKSLEQSVNITSIKILEKIGSSTACTYANRLGITSNINPYLSLVLGTFVVSPLEITKAYATLANSGIKTEPYAIIKVCDKDDKVLEERYSKEEVVLSEQTAYIMTNLLKGVVQHGTGRKALALGRPCAGKTGTTNDSTDVWFIGYTPQIVASVWVGYDDQKSIGATYTGGAVACPIWTDFMKNALKNKQYLDFNVPENIVFIPINKKTGLREFELNDKSYMEAFLKGTETEEFSDTTNLFSEAISSDTLTSVAETEEEDEDNGY
jgi:penicillin-binding protein 1A